TRLVSGWSSDVCSSDLYLAIVGNRDSKRLVSQVTEAFESAKSLRCESAALPDWVQGVGWSDHWSFWQEGYAAVMVTDTATFRNRSEERRVGERRGGRRE